MAFAINELLQIRWGAKTSFSGKMAITEATPPFLHLDEIANEKPIILVLENPSTGPNGGCGRENWFFLLWLHEYFFALG